MVSFWRFILFFCLEHLCLILHFPWFSLLVSAHCTKETPLPVFANWSHTGENPTNKLGQIILGPLPIRFPRKKHAAVFLSACSMLSQWVENYGVYQSKPPSLFFPWKLDCIRPVRASRLESQMPVLWGSLEKLVYWIHNSTASLPRRKPLLTEANVASWAREELHGIFKIPQTGRVMSARC